MAKSPAERKASQRKRQKEIGVTKIELNSLSVNVSVVANSYPFSNAVYQVMLSVG